jgi:uncharacterized membrane protein YozB (DUF420 family)
MDARLLFWTGALANMGLVLAFAVLGVWRRRVGDVPGHRRSMLTAGALVGLFLAAYVLKVVFLGREPRATWSPAALWVLRVHELCVATMLVGGATAGLRALALRLTRNASRNPADPPASRSLVLWHRRAGWTAVTAAALGFVTAALVLAGMYGRAGAP